MGRSKHQEDRNVNEEGEGSAPVDKGKRKATKGDVAKGKKKKVGARPPVPFDEKDSSSWEGEYLNARDVPTDDMFDKFKSKSVEDDLLVKFDTLIDDGISKVFVKQNWIKYMTTFGTCSKLMIKLFILNAQEHSDVTNVDNTTTYSTYLKGRYFYFSNVDIATILEVPPTGLKITTHTTLEQIGNFVGDLDEPYRVLFTKRPAAIDLHKCFKNLTLRARALMRMLNGKVTLKGGNWDETREYHLALVACLLMYIPVDLPRFIMSELLVAHEGTRVLGYGTMIRRLVRLWGITMEDRDVTKMKTYGKQNYSLLISQGRSRIPEMDLEDDPRSEFISPKAFEAFMTVWRSRERGQGSGTAETQGDQPQPPPSDIASGAVAADFTSSQQFMQGQFDRLYEQQQLQYQSQLQWQQQQQQQFEAQSLWQQQTQQQLEAQSLWQQQTQQHLTHIEQQQFLEHQRTRHELRSRTEEIADHFGRRFYRMEENLRDLIADQRQEYESRMGAAGQEPIDSLFQYDECSQIFQAPMYPSAGPPGYGYAPPSDMMDTDPQQAQEFQFFRPEPFDPVQALSSWQPFSYPPQPPPDQGDQTFGPGAPQ